MLRGDRALVKLDIDAKHARPTVTELVRKLNRAGYRVVWWWERRSPSRKGWHLCFKLRPAPRTPPEVVALQALLGSDPYREACNLRRANLYPSVPSYMRDRWNVLYRPWSKGGDNGE